MTAKLTRREFGMSSVALLGSYMRPQILETEASQLVDLLYVDLHVDTPSRLLNEGLNLSESLPYTHVDIP